MIRKKHLIFVAVISMLFLYFYLIPAVSGETALLKVIEAPQRPRYNELPGFSEISLIASLGGIAIFYLFRQKKLNKKAVSPIIATVLLVALTIAAFLIIFTWSKGFIKEQVEKSGGPVETACQSISFSAVLPDGSSSSYVTNTGNVIIYGFSVKGEKEGSSKIVFARTTSGKLGVGEADSIDLSEIKNKGYDEKITLIPVLLGKGTNSGTGKLFPCNEQARVIKG